MQRETTVVVHALAVAAALIGLPAVLSAQSQAPANATHTESPAAPLADAPTIPRNIDLNAATEFGYAFFQQKCLTCHGNPQFEKAPPPEALYQYTPERIYESLTTGVMASVIGNQLSDAERRAVSETITGQRIGAAGSGDADKMPNRCKANPPLAQAAQRPAWNGWGVDTQNTRFQTATAAGLTAADVPRLKLRWAFGLPNSTSAYAQPAMVFGRVFIGADTGYIYSLDADTGCVYWSFNAKHSVRTAMTVGRVKGANRYAVFFGDRHANVYAVDAHTGKHLWTAHPENNFTARITAAPTYYNGRLYVPLSSFEEFSAATVTYECCKSVGGIAALDANTGKLLWKRYVVPELPKPTYKNSRGVQQWGPAGGSVWNSPTVDPVRHAVYFGTGDATTYPAIPTSDAVMAVNMDTGRVLWSYQVHKNDSFLVGCGDQRTENCPKVVGPDWDIPASPVLQTLRDGTRRIIVVTKPGDVLALDPDSSGKLVWRVNVFGSVAGDGGPLRPNEPTPPGIFWGAAITQDTAYFGLTRGGVGALDIATGKRLWLNPLDTDQKVSYGSATTAFPGVVLQGASDGKLHAVSTTDGRSLWSFETRREFETVNGLKARGGSISAPGPIVADGIVLVGSGYAILGGTPGNVLLAFSAK